MSDAANLSAQLLKVSSISDAVAPEAEARNAALHDELARAAKGLADLLAIFIAIRTIAQVSSDRLTLSDQVVRTTVFAGLTIRTAFTVRLQLACAVERVLLPMRARVRPG